MLFIHKLYRISASQKNFLKLSLLGGFLLMLFGCRQYELYHYKTIQDHLLNGELVIEVVPRRTLSEKNGKKVAVESDPYSILVKFFSENKFQSIEVDRLVLKSTSSDTKLDLLSASSLDARLFPDSNRYFAIASFSKSLEGLKLKYEPYDLSATLVMTNLDGSKVKSELGYRLEPDYKRESRSDIVDGMMGI